MRSRPTEPRVIALFVVGAWLLAACSPRGLSAEPTKTRQLESSGLRASELVLSVEALTCEGCAWQIREALQGLLGVQQVITLVTKKQLIARYDPSQITPGS